MANLFEKPFPGDKFKPLAEQQRLFVDMLNWWINFQQQPGFVALNGPDITIRNTRDTALNEYSLVRLGDIVFNPSISERGFKSDLVFDADAPQADAIFAVTQEPIAPSGGVGEAKISGFSRVKVQFSNEDHRFAAPEDDNYDYLVSQASDGPAAVIWKEEGVGNLWAVVSLNVSSTPGFGATTTLCLQNCNGTEYCLEVPRDWLKPGACNEEEHEDNPPGGTSDPCVACEEPLNELCVAFPGMYDANPEFFNGCYSFSLPNTLTLGISGEPPVCTWQSYPPIPFNNVLAGVSIPVILQLFSPGGYGIGWTLLVRNTDYGSIVTIYTFIGDWDCRSPMTMYRTGDLFCAGQPETVIVQPCGPSGSGATLPTITFSSADLCDDETEITINGTGFEETPGNNLLTLNNGTATCTSTAAGTSLIASVTLTATGPLTCTIQNANGTSEVLVQVANVVTCGGTLWNDTFTEGSPPVLLTSHAAETGSGGYTNLDGAMACNSSGHAVNSSADDDFGFIFDAGIASGTFSFKFLIPPASQDASGRAMYGYFRYADSANYWRVAVGISAMADSTTAFQVQKSVSGMLSVPATGTVTLNTNTEYTCTIETTDTTVDVTINGVTAHADDGVFYSYTKRGVAFHSTFSDTAKPYCDDVSVTN